MINSMTAARFAEVHTAPEHRNTCVWLSGWLTRSVTRYRKWRVITSLRQLPALPWVALDEACRCSHVSGVPCSRCCSAMAAQRGN